MEKFKKTPKINKKELKKPPIKVKAPKANKETKQKAKIENKATAAPNPKPVTAKKVLKPSQRKSPAKNIKIIKFYF